MEENNDNSISRALNGKNTKRRDCETIKRKLFEKIDGQKYIEILNIFLRGIMPKSKFDQQMRTILVTKESRILHNMLMGSILYNAHFSLSPPPPPPRSPEPDLQQSSQSSDFQSSNPQSPVEQSPFFPSQFQQGSFRDPSAQKESESPSPNQQHIQEQFSDQQSTDLSSIRHPPLSAANTPIPSRPTQHYSPARTTHHQLLANYYQQSNQSSPVTQMSNAASFWGKSSRQSKTKKQQHINRLFIPSNFGASDASKFPSVNQLHNRIRVMAAGIDIDSVTKAGVREIYKTVLSFIFLVLNDCLEYKESELCSNLRNEDEEKTTSSLSIDAKTILHVLDSNPLFSSIVNQEFIKKYRELV